MLKGKKIGFGITGSFCSMDDMLEVLKQLVENGCEVYVFISQSIDKFDTRFNQANDLMNKIKELINIPIITSIVEAEKFGPILPLDLMVVYPCTSNTLAKLVHGINDNAVTMACKGTLRNNKNVVLGVYTNDALATSGVNLMTIANRKNYYLVPMIQDAPVIKPFSLLANPKRFIKTIGWALENKQVQPLFEGEIND